MGRHKNRKLKVSIGPSTKTLVQYNVNQDNSPMYVNSPHFEGHVVVRVKDFDGLVPQGMTPCPSTEYFGSRRRLFSIQCTGRFKEEFNAADIVFGAVFDAKVAPPTGTWLALKFATMIDPALETELNGENPYFLSPLLCAMNIMNVESLPASSQSSKQSSAASSKQTSIDALANSANALSIADEQAVFNKSPSTLPKWTFGGAVDLQEDSAMLGPEDADYDTSDSSSRRKYFQKENNRQATTFKTDRIYKFEIFAPFINMNTFDLSLGISVNVSKVLNGQPIRLVSKCRKTGKIFFCTEFKLVKLDENQSGESSSLSVASSAVQSEQSLGKSVNSEVEDEDDFVDAVEDVQDDG